MKEANNKGSLLKTALTIASAGTLLAIYIVIGFFVARWLKDMMDAPRYWLAIGPITGMVLGVIHVALLIKKMLGEQNE